MSQTTIRFLSFPRTIPPPAIAFTVCEIFAAHETEIGTLHQKRGLTSDAVLSIIRDDLRRSGFQVETSKLKKDKIERPVFFGENGQPALKYEVDAYHPEWKAGLEIEAGRAVMGNAIYRDLVQALVMVEVDNFITRCSACVSLSIRWAPGNQQRL